MSALGEYLYIAVYLGVLPTGKERWMSVLIDADQRAVMGEADPDRRPRVCDWDKIEQHRRISPPEVFAADWYLVR